MKGGPAETSIEQSLEQRAPARPAPPCPSSPVGSDDIVAERDCLDARPARAYPRLAFHCAKEMPKAGTISPIDAKPKTNSAGFHLFLAQSAWCSKDG